MKLVGFNRRTDRLAVEKAIPAEAASAVRTIANVPASDPDLRASYQLTEEQVRQIAELARLTIEPDRFDYFLEARET
jgi:hypothetical protein